MTMTETEAPSTTSDPSTGDAPTLQPPLPASGLAGLLGTADHKPLGRLWIITSFVYLLITGVTGAMVGVERIDTADIGVIDLDVFAQTFSLHAVGGTFLFLVPLLLGIAIYVVPLQIGASNVAFPRAVSAAYWTYLVAGAIVLASYVGDGGAFGSDDEFVALFTAGLIAVLLSLTLAAITVATTGIALRTPGMSMRRTPLFTWSNVLFGGMAALTLPALAGVLLLAYVDLRYGPVFLAGSAGLYGRMAWVWNQPSVFLFAIPALGFAADVVPVAARTRLVMHKVAMFLIGAFAALSFGVWAMPAFQVSATTGFEHPYVGEAPYYGFSFLIVVPVLGLLALFGLTLRQGSVRLISPLLWGLSAVLLVLGATVEAALISIEPLDLFATTAQSGLTHTVIIAATMAALGGLAYWAPKFSGRKVPEVPSNLLALAGLAGAAAIGIADLVSGFLDQSVGLLPPVDNVGAIEALNAVALAGGVLVAGAALGFVGLLMTTAGGARDAGDDPWEGNTLEWVASSPPEPGNFDELPGITSEAPLYDARHADGEAS